MSDLNTGELCDELGLTLAEFWQDNVERGQYEANRAMDNFLSRNLERLMKLSAQKKKSGMNGRVGTEA